MKDSFICLKSVCFRSNAVVAYAKVDMSLSETPESTTKTTVSTITVWLNDVQDPLVEVYETSKSCDEAYKRITELFAQSNE